MTIRILLVDDHQMFREGLRAILERDARVLVVGEASEGRQAMQMAAKSPAPDVVVMDIGMPGLNGVDAARQILSNNPNVKVVALSAHNDPRFVAAALEAGASGYVLKESASEEILRAIFAVHRGGKYLNPDIAVTVLDGYLSHKTRAGKPRSHALLSNREREIVQLLAEGKSTKEVANLLQISIKTAETHRSNIMSKLKLHSVASLTKFAIREGLTSAEG